MPSMVALTDDGVAQQHVCYRSGAVYDTVADDALIHMRPVGNAYMAR